MISADKLKLKHHRNSVAMRTLRGKLARVEIHRYPYRYFVVGFMALALVDWGWRACGDFRNPEKAKLARVQVGMDRQEVQWILGEPIVVADAADGHALFFQAEGATMCAVFSFETGLVIEKSWNSQSPESEWRVVWRWIAGQ